MLFYFICVYNFCYILILHSLSIYPLCSTTCSCVCACVWGRSWATWICMCVRVCVSLWTWCHRQLKVLVLWKSTKPSGYPLFPILFYQISLPPPSQRKCLLIFCLFIWVCAHVSEDKWWELVISFPHLGSRDWTQLSGSADAASG